MENRVAAIIVMDAVGLDTLDYLLSKHNQPINLPNLASWGLGEIVSPQNRVKIGKKTDKTAFAAPIEQASASADSVVGHREMMGIIDDRVFNLFPNGFPENYIRELERRIGRKTFFNKMAGGMDTIALNAEEHERTGFPIVYASKCDPLIQIAMNEAVIPIKEQHFIADTAFKLAMEMGIPVTRAIARAYIKGADGEISRTANRHDAVLPIEGKTLPDILRAHGVWVSAVGKTAELVNTAWDEKIKITDRVLVEPALQTAFVHPKFKDTNPFSAQGTLNALRSAKTQSRPNGSFIFSNFVDTDSLYGHTRDVEGSLRSLEATDKMLGAIIPKFQDGDLLIITADHGMAHRENYGFHNKEPLPFIVKSFGASKPPTPASLKTLATIGLMSAEFFGCGTDFAATTKTGGFFKKGD